MLHEEKRAGKWCDERLSGGEGVSSWPLFVALGRTRVAYINGQAPITRPLPKIRLPNAGRTMSSAATKGSGTLFPTTLRTPVPGLPTSACFAVFAFC